MVRVTYDRSVDAAYILLRDIALGEVARSQEIVIRGRSGECTLTFDFATGGELLGVEVLDASDLLPESLLRTAEPP